MSNTNKLLFLLLLINVPGFAQVGVGTTTPQYPLDVNGRIRIQYHNRSQEGAGLWFNKPDNTLGTFIGQTAAGHFGVAANASGNWNFVFDHQHTRLGIGTDAPSSPLTIKMNGLGLEHVSANGAVSLGTYVSNISAYIQTNTNTPLRFATNNADGQLTLGTNGYFGIGTLTPNHPLSFASVVGDKISLWSADATSATAPHYGLGIQGYQFQLFAPAPTDNIVFGIGSSANFTENVRFTGDGKVGIGNTNPQAKLDVAGNVKIADGTQGAGKVLTSDASGYASWQKSGYGAVTFTMTYNTSPSYDLRNGATPLLAGVEQLDDDNRYNDGNYTVGQTGYYLLNGSLMGNSDGNTGSVSNTAYFKVQVYVNNNLTRVSTESEANFTRYSNTPAGFYFYHYPSTLNTIVKCNAGDVITLRLSGRGVNNDVSNCRVDEVQFTITKL